MKWAGERGVIRGEVVAVDSVLFGIFCWKWGTFLDFLGMGEVGDHLGVCFSVLNGHRLKDSDLFA